MDEGDGGLTLRRCDFHLLLSSEFIAVEKHSWETISGEAALQETGSETRRSS